MLRLILLPLICISAAAAQPKLTPRHDPTDQVIRWAPMAQSSRSIVVNFRANVHAAFDAEFARIHTIWRGGPLNLWGPPYSYAKSPFICDFDGEVVFSFPPVSPWYVSGKAAKVEYRGSRIRGGLVEFEYEVGPDQIKIVESIEAVTDADQWTVRRMFTLPKGGKGLQDLSWLAYAEGGAEIEGGRTLKVRGTNGVVYLTLHPEDFRWELDNSEQQYKGELITEAGTEKGNPVQTFQGPERRAFVRVPLRRRDPFQFAVMMSSTPTPMEIPRAKRARKEPQTFDGPAIQRESGDEHYLIEHFALPAEAEMMVTGMDWFDDSTLAVCTWLGEIYLIENATGPVTDARYRRFARGLNEPLGLTVVNGAIFVVQKGELTRVSDQDKDGIADLFECVSDDWGYSGNYHSYSFGPLPLKEDRFMVFVTGQRGRYDLLYQGWAIGVGREGVKPFCSGLRVPHGWGYYEGDIFVTDNQGNWIGGCKLNHLQEGKFYGFPSSLPSSKKTRTEAEVEPPALWFPRSLSPSASGFDTINSDAFGPFQGQILIGDFQNSILMRANLEKVKGKWQGAVFPFAKGFLSGVNRVRMGQDGRLYVGGGKRTWSTAAPREYSLDRVSFTGKVPFEVKEVRATKDGFELHFTKRLELEPGADPENYLVKQWRYQYHQEYGSPEFDHEGKPGATEVMVKSATVSADGMKVQLVIPELKERFVTAIQLAVNSAEDEDLRTDTFYYTLNHQPD